MKLLPVLVALCTIAAPALSHCPDVRQDHTQETLILTRTDPFFEIRLSRDENGTLTEMRSMTGGLDTRTTYLADIWASERTDDNGTLSLQYGGDPATLALTEIGATLSLPVRLFAESAEMAKGSETKRVHDQTEMTIGDCTYDVMVILNRLELDGMRTGYSYSLYSPVLGLIIGNVVTDADYAPVRSVFFDKLSHE